MVKTLLRRRTWVLLLVAVTAQLFTGLIYIFSVLAEVLVENGFTPAQTDWIYACGTLGQYFGVIPGFLHDLAGPRAAGGYGIVATALGYGSVLALLGRHMCALDPGGWLPRNYHFVSGGEACALAPPPPAAVAALGIGMFLLAQGGASVHYASFPTLLKQFPAARRGLVSGIVAGSYGLSGVVLTAMFDLVFDRALGGFLATLGLIVLGLSALILALLHAEPTEEGLSPPASARGEAQKPRLQRRHSVFALEVEHTRVLSQPLTLAQVMFNPKYLMYTVAMACMQGTCAAVVGNVVLLREANGIVGIPTTAMLVSWISLANFAGRIASGFLSQLLPLQYYFVFFLTGAILITTSQLTLYLGAPCPPTTFTAALLAVAASMGTNFAMGPVWIMQNFPDKHFASLQATLMGAVAVSTFALSVFSGKSYERVATLQLRKAHTIPVEQSKAPQHLTCFGPECFKTAQLTESTMNIIAAILICLVGV